MRTKHVRPVRFSLTFISTMLLIPGLVLGAGQSRGRFIDPEYHYSIAIPTGWTQKIDQPRPLVAFLGPTEEGFRVNITIYSEPVAAMTLAQFIKASKAQMTKTKGLYIHDESKTTLGGLPAVRLRSHLEVEGKQPVENSQVVCTHNKRGFVITLTALPSNVKKYTPIFNTVLKSFRW